MCMRVLHRFILGPVVRGLNNFIQRINLYPADKTGAFLILIGQNPLDRDLSTGERYPGFLQLDPGKYASVCCFE